MNPIIVALDGKSYEESMRLAKILKGHVWGFKVNDLFFSEGMMVVEELGKEHNVMLDVKLFDIPNTVANITKRFSQCPADIVTIHATGGVEMIKAAVKNLPGKVAAVTCLTSFDADSCAASYDCASPSVVVTNLVKLATEGGASHIVCSSQELKLACFESANKWAFKGKKIIPGIRPAWYQDADDDDDQKRTMTPAEAMAAGADMLVMGRPILRATDPVEAAQRTLAEIKEASE